MRKLFALIALALFLSPLVFAIPTAMEPQTKIVKFGENVHIPKGAEVDSVVAVGGSVTVSGTVRTDVISVGGNVALDDTAHVGGDVVSVGGSVHSSPKAVLRGDQIQVGVPAAVLGKGARAITWAGALFAALSFAAFLVLALVIASLFYKQIGKTSYYIEKHTGPALLWGLLGAVLIPTLIIMLVLTLIGIIFIPIFVLLIIAALIFGYIAASQLLGKRVLRAFKQLNKPMIAEILAGMLALFLIGFMPILGMIITCLAHIFGLGAVIATRFGTSRV